MVTLGPKFAVVHEQVRNFVPFGAPGTPLLTVGGPEMRFFRSLPRKRAGTESWHLIT